MCQKIVYVEYTQLNTIIEKLCMLNLLNCVYYLKSVYVECT